MAVMTNDTGTTQELSVEEILTSIRKVIRGQALHEGRNDCDDSVLELTNEYCASVVDNCDRVDCVNDDNFRDDDCDDMYDANGSLIDNVVASETASILGDFVKQMQHVTTTASEHKSGQTIEELVVDVMKPELRKWLNQNLPTIVRDVVEKEVRRLMPK